MSFNLIQLFKAMVDEKAADMSLVSFSPPRLRVAGNLVPLELPGLSPDQISALCLELLTDSQKEQLKHDKVVDTGLTVKNLARFRCHLFYENGRLAANFRLVPFHVPSLEELGLPAYAGGLTGLKSGVVLIGGDRCSGRSTTAASLIETINGRRFGHIVTIGQPTEHLFIHKNSIVSQLEVGTDCLSVAEGFYEARRKGADVVMSQSLDDSAAVLAAFELAGQGVLVLAVVEGRTIERVLHGVFHRVERNRRQYFKTLLADQLQAVLAHALVPRVSRGQVLALEHLRLSYPLHKWLATADFPAIDGYLKQHCPPEWGQSLNRNLVDHLQAGVISAEEARLASCDLVDLESILKAYYPKKQA